MIDNPPRSDATSGDGPLPGSHILTRKCGACGQHNSVTFDACRGCKAALGAATFEPTEEGPGLRSYPIGEQTEAMLARIVSAAGAHEFYALRERQSIVGRECGDPFAMDPYITPHHCGINLVPDGAMVEDINRVSGVYIEVQEGGSDLRAGDMIRFGEQLLRLDIPAGVAEHAQLSSVAGITPEGWSMPLRAHQATVLGRTEGDVTFAEDALLAPRHCEIRREGHSFRIYKLDNERGTFLRCRGASFVPFGGRFFIGQLLFTLFAAPTLRA